MYIDGFVNALMFLLPVSMPTVFLITNTNRKLFSYKTIMVIRKTLIVVSYLLLTIFVFLLGFFRIHYLYTAIIFYSISTSLLLFTIVDTLYFQTIKDEYIVSLQKQLCRDGNTKKLFDVVEYKCANYIIKKEDDRQLYGIANVEGYGECIGSEVDKVLYVPKTKLDKEYLQFYAKCLETEKDCLPIFKNKNEFKQYLKSYQFIKPCKCYYFIKRNKKTITAIVAITFALFFLSLLIVYLLATIGSAEIRNWFMMEIN